MPKTQRLKEFRNAIGISQTQLAKSIDVTPQSIQKKEAGNSGFSEENLIKLCGMYNLNINWLLTGEGNMFVEPKNTLDIKSQTLKIDWFEVGNRIRKIRIQNDLLSNQMAQMLEISEKELVYISTGEKIPSYNFLVKICENFNVTLDWLLFGKE